MVERLADSRVPVGDSGWAVTSLSPADPGFQPTRYWRGPVWPILNWVLQRGLERYGYRERAAQVRQAVVDLGRSAGFWEHYDPLTGKGTVARSSPGPPLSSSTFSRTAETTRKQGGEH